MKSESCSVVPDSLWPYILQPTQFLCPWNSPGQNPEVGSLSLLHGIFPTQGSNPGLPHCRQILYQLSHKGHPRILEWVAHPSSSGSSWPRKQTRISCIVGRLFTNWAIRIQISFSKCPKRIYQPLLVYRNLFLEDTLTNWFLCNMCMLCKKIYSLCSVSNWNIYFIEGIQINVSAS